MFLKIEPHFDVFIRSMFMRSHNRFIMVSRFVNVWYSWPALVGVTSITVGQMIYTSRRPLSTSITRNVCSGLFIWAILPIAVSVGAVSIPVQGFVWAAHRNKWSNEKFIEVVQHEI